MTHILLIEDDKKLGALLQGDLELEGFVVTLIHNGKDGLEAGRKRSPDLIILDVMMPQMSGYDVCRSLRKEDNNVPIIMLTAKGQESEKVIGLQMGADDYVTKPFSGLELVARIQALLRRHQRGQDQWQSITFDDVAVNFKRMEATQKGRSLALTAKEFLILEFFVRHPGEVISRERFLQEVWGYDEELPTTRTVDNQILSLRQKLSSKDKDQYILTVHGAGYKFIGSVHFAKS